MAKDMKQARKRVFPTSHPFKNINGQPSVSNVKMGSFTFADGTRVIPTMVDGELQSTAGALQRARSEGLNKYPLFKDVPSAEKWIEQNHGNVDEQGFLVQKK
tara:strand:+ start:220 stop:525 length:306 start_codon:yes stop_codon:yes gene_type:complete